MQSDKRESCAGVSQHTMRKCYPILFLFFFVTYGYFFQGGGWNQNGRIYLTQAIINHGTFAIDAYKEDAPQMEFVNMGDWAFCRGHYYSNKSPGLSFLAVPPFALARYLASRTGGFTPEQQVLACAYFSNLCTTVLLSTLLCLLLFYVCVRLFNLGINEALLLTLAFGLGTLAFPYSTAFYCHQPAAFCLFFSLVLALHIRHGSSQKKQILAAAAGLLAATGVLIEPSALYLLAAVFIYLVWFKECRQYSAFFILGCIPAVLAQCFYNYSCFGKPFASSYDFANPAVMVRINGRLFGAPSPETLLQLLVSPYRGLLFTSPVLLMMLPGAIYFFREKKWRAEALFCAGASALFFIFIAGFYAWNGGSAPGPRYLLPAYPWFFLLTIFAVRRLPNLFRALAVISIVINLAITAVGVEIPAEIKNPLLDVVLQNLAAGRVSINPVPFSHFNNYPDIYQLAKIENWPSIQNFNSFNLGEALFPHSPASIVPLLCFWLACAAWWTKRLSPRAAGGKKYEARSPRKQAV